MFILDAIPHLNNPLSLIHNAWVYIWSTDQYGTCTGRYGIMTSNFIAILIETQFFFKKSQLKMLSATWQPLCSGLCWAFRCRNQNIPGEQDQHHAWLTMAENVYIFLCFPK